MFNGIKGILSVSILSFAFLGVATVLPESAWESLPSRLIPVRTLLADRGIISKRFAASPTVTQINACETASLPNTPLEPLPAESGQTAQAIAPAAAPADEPAAQPSRRSLLELSAADTVLPPPATTVPAEVPVSSSSYEFISPLAAARPREYSPEPAEPPSAPPAAEFPMVENPLAGIPPIQDVSATAIDTVPQPAARKLQSRFDSGENSSPQGMLVPQVTEETRGSALPQGDQNAADPTGFLPLLRSSESPQATDDTLPQLRFEASEGVRPLEVTDRATLSQSASLEPAGSTVAQRLDTALAMSADPDRKLEAFLELNRILNQSGTLLGENDRQRIYTVLDRLAFDIFYNPKVFLLEPGYQVQSSETLASIAPRYSVEPEFLAVLNQLKIGPNDPLPAGTQLKVIRGPVDAQVSLGRMELLLRFNGLYAGRFKLGCTAKADAMRGTYNILRKIQNPEYHGPIAPTNAMGVVAGGDPSNPLGPCWIELGQGFGLQGTNDPTLIGRKNASVGGLIFSNKDIAHLNILLPTGASVTLVD
ncbi:MAG: hypothetical protein IIZ25_09005 [Thermoguttaceae bacterium]|nr:hypothetical protein [Thermoguttaceae bacterium]